MEQTEEDIRLDREKLKKIMQFGILTQREEEIQKKMQEMKEASIRSEVLKEIKTIDNDCSYSIVKRAMKEQWSLDGSLRFFINKNKIIRGKVTNKIEDGIVDIPLIQKYEKIYATRMGVQTELGIIPFGEKKDKEAKIVDSLSHRFHIYRIVCKEGMEIQFYTLLSQQPLENEEYEIHGMLVEMEDATDLSKYTKVMKKSHILIVNEFRSSKITFSSKESFINQIKSLNITEDIFFENLLAINTNNKYLYFQHPRYFEKLIGAFFTSAKYDSSPYPPHLLIIGKQGGGKSKAMEALSEKIEETIPIVEGSGSTMKSLIPSFKSDLTKPGALIESNRMVFIDEFFRILMRVDKDDRENTLTHLNPLLEHKKRRFASGNNFLDAQMTSRMFAVTNPVFGTSTMESLVKKMDNSFLSRIIIWYQDEEHYEEVIKKKENDLRLVDVAIDNNMWKAIFDFCTSFKADFNADECYKIHQEGLALFGNLSEEIREIYKQRYKHHLACLLDGIVKVRCIIEKDSNFKATEADYTAMRGIWFKMIENWKKGLENVRFQYREDRFY
jgi:hypothetical protein